MHEFYQSAGGRRFIDGTMVTIAQSLKNIDQSLRLIVAQQEKRGMRVYMDEDMYLASPHKTDHEYMDRKLKEKNKK
tara:strand:+ start:766 stop:993 length:228 start_codon:yes stop_codon:yes gene_type:complete